MTVVTPRRRVHPALLAGPVVLVVGGLLVAFAGGGAAAWLGVLLVLLGPGVVGLAWSDPDPAGRRIARGGLAVIAAGIGAVVAGWVLAVLPGLGCADVASAFDILPNALAMGVVAGLVFTIPAVAAAVMVREGRAVLAVAVAGLATLFLIGGAMVLAVSILFPVVACGPIP